MHSRKELHTWLKLQDYLDSSLSSSEEFGFAGRAHLPACSGDSIDAVAVGVRRGNGQRSSVYGSFLLAVRPVFLLPSLFSALVERRVSVQRDAGSVVCHLGRKGVLATASSKQFVQLEQV